ncbi:hypothetical protein WDV93_12275 [Pantoea ananatis]
MKKYLGTVVPPNDNFFAALNSAVASDGTFVYIPKRCVARWSCLPISALTLRKPVSSNVRF